MSSASLWFTKSDASALCGMSVRQFSDAIQPRLSSGEVSGSGQKLRLSGPAVVSALVAYRTEHARSESGGDPMLGGGTSPALEQYRKARAGIAALDLLERRGELARLRVIQDALRPALVALRAGGDRLVRTFGNEAGEIFNEAVGEFEAAALRVIEQHGAGAAAGR